MDYLDCEPEYYRTLCWSDSRRTAAGSFHKTKNHTDLSAFVIRRRVIRLQDQCCLITEVGVRLRNDSYSPPTSKAIRWTLYAHRAPIENVRVDHRRPEVGMSEKLLYCADVSAVLQQMRRKGVPERVASRAFLQSCAPNGRRNCALKRGFVIVVPTSHARLRFGVDSQGRKDILPGELAVCVGILDREGTGERRPPKASAKVQGELFLDPPQLA